MRNYLLFFLILIMTILGATASCFLKKASTQKNFVMMLKKCDVYIGAFLYIIAASLNVVALRFMDYSIVLPLTSITYIWTIVISHCFLQERITVRKIWGVGCIVAGVSILVM